MIKNIKRGYKTELAPNKGQRELLTKHAGVARFAWNWGLERRINEYKKMGRSRGAIEQHRQLNALKAINYPWMYEVSKCSPQESLRDLDKAFTNFFRRVKQKKEGKFNGKVGFPRFKSRRKGLGSFRFTGAIHIKEGQVKLPRIGWVRLKERGYLPTNGVNILSVTVSERAGRWFVSVQVEENIEAEFATGPQMGVDLGIKTMIACSNGEVFENPKALRSNERKLARLQRRMCRQQKGSNRRNRTKRQVARLHLRISNIRNDAIHKATSSIVAKTKPREMRPSSIVIEDLNVSGMLKNRRLSKSISDVSFGELQRQFEYKCLWSGINLIVADRFYPSSKTCSECGAVKSQLGLSERKFVCEDCGCILDRDLNASLNLKALAGSSPERINGRGGNVRPVVEDGQISMKRQPEMCHMS